MGTRGIMGFRLNEKDFLTYNHYDSYPSGLGKDILADLRLVKIDELKKLVEAVKLIDEESKPTESEVIELKKYLDISVGQTFEQTEKEGVSWYQLLRNLQGNFLETIKSGYMIDSHEFIRDSLFCEWAYIVNFDTNEFEVYEGFQKVKAEVMGRYAKLRRTKDSEYYACSLVKAYDLNKLPSDEVFIAETERE